jgi:hypothetical protein
MTGSNSDKPDWWRANEELRQEYQLPSFTPPSFQDGRYVHSVVEDIEEQHNCTIQIVSQNPTADEGWTVLVDGTEVLRTERYRNKDVNAKFKHTSDKFRKEIKRQVK